MIPVGVGVIAKLDNKFILVQESHSNKDLKKSAGQFSFPSGHLEKNEKIIEAAEREFLEETGYECKVKSIVGIYNIKLATGFVFEAEIISKDKKLKPEEKVHLLTYDEIAEKDLRLANKEVLEDFVNGVRYPIDLIKEITP